MVILERAGEVGCRCRLVPEITARFAKAYVIALTLTAGCRETFRFQRRTGQEEPMLTFPDVIAWCWARGGRWRDRIRSAVVEVRGV